MSAHFLSIPVHILTPIYRNSLGGLHVSFRLSSIHKVRVKFSGPICLIKQMIDLKSGYKTEPETNTKYDPGNAET